MTTIYLSQGEVAQFIGVRETSIPSLAQPLPEPDVIIGDTLKRPTKGWTQDTIADWHERLGYHSPALHYYWAGKPKAPVIEYCEKRSADEKP